MTTRGVIIVDLRIEGGWFSERGTKPTEPDVMSLVMAGDSNIRSWRYLVAPLVPRLGEGVEVDGPWDGEPLTTEEADAAFDAVQPCPNTQPLPFAGDMPAQWKRVELEFEALRNVFEESLGEALEEDRALLMAVFLDWLRDKVECAEDALPEDERTG